MELKEKVDYVSLLFRQIDRCNSSREGFSEAVDHLRVLCVPFEDKEFLERLDVLEKVYSENVSKIENYRLLSYDEKLAYKRQYIYDRAIGVFRAIIELLNRKGVIIEHLRMGKE